MRLARAAFLLLELIALIECFLFLFSTGIATSLTNTTAPKIATKESTKNKKSKDKDQKAAEEKKRQQDEEERQQLEERKRLELIAAQRKAKLTDAGTAPRVDQTSKRNNLAASVGMAMWRLTSISWQLFSIVSERCLWLFVFFLWKFVAPWSNITENASATTNTQQLSLAEIQKLERERRSEQYRLEQAQQQANQVIIDQQQKESVLKWKLSPQNHTKSLTEIQAEESRARQSIQQISAANAVSIGFVFFFKEQWTT